ncbi:MAG: hypothetical protein COS84_07290, partial [Armatimonadetes bacterium CG07_land_8_20_14_0_80_40_9]
PACATVGRYQRQFQIPFYLKSRGDSCRGDSLESLKQSRTKVLPLQSRADFGYILDDLTRPLDPKESIWYNALLNK